MREVLQQMTQVSIVISVMSYDLFHSCLLMMSLISNVYFYQHVFYILFSAEDECTKDTVCTIYSINCK